MGDNKGSSIGVLSIAAILVALMTTLTFIAHDFRNNQSLPKPQVAALTSGPSGILTGDCNGDNKVDAGDISALTLEIYDGDGTSVADVGGGTFAGTAGCDANSDGIIDNVDSSCINGIIFNDLEQYCPVASGCVADINQDGVADLTDFSLLQINFLKTNPTNARTDITNDGVVDLSDFSLLQVNFLKTCNL